MNRAKRAFTLIELLLVISLVGITLGWIAIQAPKAFRGESFERGVDQVKTRIILAQEIMLNYQTDVVLTLDAQHNEGLICKLTTGKPISQKLQKNLDRHECIKGIETAEFEGETPQLFFDSTLGAIPKGKLILKGRDQQAILTLKGFPSQIFRGDHVPQEEEATYPETLISFI